MAKIKYRDWSPGIETMQRVVLINSILAEYQTAVSVRQLYYRLVARQIIANNDKEYGKVQDLVTKARYAGLIDWDAIEDRNREPYKPQDWESGRAILTGAASTFRVDRWATQPFYLELWVEKAALAGVLAPISRDYHITLMVNRGYSSASAMKESAERIIHRSRASKHQQHGHRPVIIYVGDHDPSGIHMADDIGQRLREFGCPAWMDVRRLVLTMDQIQEHHLPTNPAKESDSRARDYIKEYGEYSWEADALPPNVLDLTVRQAVSSYIDKDAMKAAITRENLIKKRIADFAASFKEEG